MQQAVAHQHKAGIVRHLSPFVKIESQRIGALNAFEAGRELGRKHSQRAARAVHVKP